MVAQVYRPRKPRASPLWQCLTRHFDTFQAVYEKRYQSRHGYLRPIIPEVVNKFMDCGDLERGFARIRCDHCQKDHLLAFSCKGRWFCPSCHQKKVQLFGSLLTETILFPVPHRHVTLTIPKMLRPYFRYHRDLLKDLCRIAHECVRDVMRISLDQPDGMPGIVMAIHTFGEYLDFHPHLHLLMADGLFLRDERFLVLPDNGMDAVEELFRAKLITFLSKKGLLQPDRARMLKAWKHSGFNVHRSRRIMPDERKDLERVARYIIRNPFSTDEVDEEIEVIDVSEHQPRRIPSKKWRDLIKKVWEADPLICPTCQREMRIVSLIDERDVIEKMLKCLGLWQQGVRVDPQRQTGTDPPNGDWVYELVDQDPFPDYDTEPVLFYANA